MHISENYAFQLFSSLNFSAKDNFLHDVEKLKNILPE